MELKNIDVVLIAGQSNALGISPNSGLPDYKDKVYLNTQIFQMGALSGARQCNQDTCNKIMPVRLGLGFNDSTFGLEMGVADYLERENRQAFILKFACDGTSLYNEWRPPSSGNAGKHFLSCVNHFNTGLNKIKQLGYAPRILGLAWMQGSSDAVDECRAREYSQNLVNLAHDFKKALGNDLKIVVGEINIDYTLMPYCDIVIAQQKIACQKLSDAIFLPTSDLQTMETDHWHYDAKSEFELGKRFAKEILKGE